ncbi:TetR/AcrR family transcriptional regulator [Corallococcus sp. M34]|uniref:TetR/AcrR family transcriptional regulator n=1 Tax=Citreicoccus inhibens TaxID=2849499 RepID=UPI001C24CD75|nr:TetR/AcrR family transcriptional regulator [Citreicoccus inhibens]MBU8896930.1 TetR/AcrR family transcriptional regulator [Citreicoccus inhibens]
MPRPNVREKLVAAGLKTLLRQGFNGCGVQDITAAAGVPKGSFYNHFESKEALGVECINRYLEGPDARAALLTDASVAPRERLRRYFSVAVETLVAWKFERGCLLGNFAVEMADHSALIRERVAQGFTAWCQELEPVIQESQRAGEVSDSVSAATLAAFLINAWEGAVLRSRADKSRAALDDFLRVAFDKVLC